MDTEQFLTWGRNRHFPQLVLSDREVLRAGELSWQRFTRCATSTHMQRATSRVAQWQVWEEKRRQEVSN